MEVEKKPKEKGWRKTRRLLRIMKEGGGIMTIHKLDSLFDSGQISEEEYEMAIINVFR